MASDFAEFDDIIDVRSPSEFAEDHLPGAISLPVLNDEQRAQVGTIYKQVSPFDARKIGAALVAENAAKHIRNVLADRDGSWKALVYCWRGGQRSGSFATILRQIGWRTDTIEGGYKAWRARVVERVQNIPVTSPVVVLDGNTGSAKTAILNRLALRGSQVIDLEGLARHRGSLFGAMPGGQPTQKLFEGRLAVALENLDPTRHVLIEAESSRIGNLMVPKTVWREICAAPRIRLEVPLTERAAYSLRDYRDIADDPMRLDGIFTALSSLHSRERIEDWRSLASTGDLIRLAEGLMRDHYDPRYAKHRARYSGQEKAVLPVTSLRDLDRVAAQIEAALARLAQ